MTARLAEIGHPTYRLDAVEVRAADDVSGGGAGVVSGCLMSVAQLQAAMRIARQHPADRTQALGPAPIAHAVEPVGRDRVEEFVAPSSGHLCVVVRAAHGGAGASTVALAVADATTATGRRTHLVEFVAPARSGLLGVATAELGVDPSGRWRHGSRGNVTVSRPTGRTAAGTTDVGAGGVGAATWPATVHRSVDSGGVTIFDAGLARGDGPLATTSGLRLAAPGGGDELGGLVTLVVFRVTVPGVRHAEFLLAGLTGAVVLAAVGPARWPGEVRSSTGPLLAGYRGSGLLITVPLDRRLEVSGLDTGPLPKQVAAAGRDLLALLDAA